jgi:hypothetical protein
VGSSPRSRDVLLVFGREGCSTDNNRLELVSLSCLGHPMLREILDLDM